MTARRRGRVLLLPERPLIPGLAAPPHGAAPVDARARRPRAQVGRRGQGRGVLRGVLSVSFGDKGQKLSGGGDGGGGSVGVSPPHARVRRRGTPRPPGQALSGRAEARGLRQGRRGEEGVAGRVEGFRGNFFLLLRRKGKKTDGGKPRRPKERNCGQGGQSKGIERIGGSSPPCSGGRSRASDEPSSRLPKAAAAQKAREQQQFFFLFPPFFFSPRSFLFVSFTPRPSNRSRTRNPATPSTPCARSG